MIQTVATPNTVMGTVLYGLPWSRKTGRSSPLSPTVTSNVRHPLDHDRGASLDLAAAEALANTRVGGPHLARSFVAKWHGAEMHELVPVKPRGLNLAGNKNNK
jgi:hypothetical protein